MKSPWLIRLGGIAFSHRFRLFKKFHLYTDPVNDEIQENWISLGFFRIRTGVEQRNCGS